MSLLRVKGLIELIGLGATRAGVSVYPSDRVKLRRRYVFIAAAIVATMFITAYSINLPHMLDPTHPRVQAAKKLGRDICVGLRTNPQFEKGMTPEEALNDKTAAHEVLADHSRRITVSQLIVKLTNPFIFGTGVMYAVLPFLVILLLHVVRIRKISEARVAQLLSLCDVVTWWGCFAWVLFFYFVEYLRVSRCLLTSGHWQTVTLTTFSLIWVLLQLHSTETVNRSSFFSLTSFEKWYLMWAIIYFANVVPVLCITQRFYHDDVEALDGIRTGLYGLPVMVVIALFVGGEKEPTPIPSVVVASEKAVPTQVASAVPAPPTLGRQVSVSKFSFGGSSVPAAPPAPPAPVIESSSAEVPAAPPAPEVPIPAPPPPPPAATISPPPARATRSITSSASSSSSAAASSSSKAKAKPAAGGGGDLMSDLRKRIKQRGKYTRDPLEEIKKRKQEEEEAGFDEE